VNFIVNKERYRQN